MFWCFTYYYCYDYFPFALLFNVCAPVTNFFYVFLHLFIVFRRVGSIKENNNKTSCGTANEENPPPPTRFLWGKIILLTTPKLLSIVNECVCVALSLYTLYLQFCQRSAGNEMLKKLFLASNSR